MRIVNKNKFIKSILILVLLILLIIIFSKPTLSHKKELLLEIYVSNGDTLWEIAGEQKNINNYYKNKDIRYIIEDIKAVSHLENSIIYTGQKLYIHTY